MEEQVYAKQGHEAAESVCMYICDKNLSTDQHQSRYSVSMSREIVMLFHISSGASPTNKYICIYPNWNQLCGINSMNLKCNHIT